MENREKEYIMLRWGLALKLVLDRNRLFSEEQSKKGIRDKNIINSFGRLYLSSGIPKATLLNISQGRKNAASTTWTAILEALDMSLGEFSVFFDAITEEQVWAYKKELESAREKRTGSKGESRE